MRTAKNLDTSTPEATSVAASALSRRTLVKTAAWSLPVIAIAVAAPAASASANQGAKSAGVSATGVVNSPSAGLITSQFTNGFWAFTGVVGSWPTGLITSVVSITNVTNPVFTQVGGAAFGSTITVGAITWTVSISGSTITFTAPSQTIAGNQTIVIPNVQVVGSFVHPSTIGAQVVFSAEEILSSTFGGTTFKV